MNDQDKLTVELVAAAAENLAGIEIRENDRAAVAALLNAIRGDMIALKSLDIGEGEPATTYSVEPL